MQTCFDVRPGDDVIFVAAAPSWITGQSYAVSGPLTTRVTTVVASGMVEARLAECFAQIVTGLKVTLSQGLAIPGATPPHIPQITPATPLLPRPVPR